MKTTFTTLLLIFTWASSLFGQAYSGGQIQVTNKADNEFEFELTYIQNCYSCSDGALCPIPNTMQLEYGKRSINLKLKIVDAKSTPLNNCSDCNRCTNDSCAVEYGFTTYTLKASADLDSIIKQSICTFKALVVAEWIDKNLGAISTDFDGILLSTSFNACEMNTTPKSDYFGGLICLGRDAILKLHSNSIDSNSNGTMVDELAYSVVPIKNENGTVSYTSNYAYDKPLYYLGFPKGNLKFPRGFHIDSTKGIVSFRPMKVENSMFRLKIEETRDGKWLSTSYKDIHIEVTKCPNNNPPILSGINCGRSFKTSVAVGEQLCFTICTSDRDKGDSTKLTWNNAIPNATFKLISDSVKRQSAKFCWTPKYEDVSKFPYTFVASVIDNGCPKPLSIEQTYQITVKDKPRVKIISSAFNCGNGMIIVEDTGTVGVSEIILSINGRIIVRKGALKDTFHLSSLNQGYNNFTLTVRGINGIPNIIEDSLYSSGISPFTTNEIEYVICPRDSAFVSLGVYARTGTNMQWSNNIDARQDSFFHPLSDETHTVIGKNGTCTDTFKLKIDVLNFNGKIEAQNKSGNAPLIVQFSMIGERDADTISIDFGDGNSVKSPIATDSFRIDHIYQNKGLYDFSFILSKNGESCGNSATVYRDYIDVFPTGLYKPESLKLDIYPNPNNGDFIIKTDKNIESIKAFSMNGKQIEVSLNSTGTYSIQNAKKGLYLLEIALENQTSIKQLLSIE